MNTKAGNCCDQFIHYFTGDCSISEKQSFEEHLRSCSYCQNEMNDLQQVWNALPFQAEEIEVPDDLKSQVMNVIFKDEPLEDTYLGQKPKKRMLWKLSVSSYRWAAAVLLVALIAATWNNFILREQLNAVEEHLGEPIQVTQVFSLSSADSLMAAAEGKAWLLRQGNRMKLVFQFKGLSDTEGEEAYQVWLIHKGQRTNAGTFHVDEQGNGVLTYEMKDREAAFEAIGITLEPDPHGSQPRGKKVLGTKKVNLPL